MLRVLSHVKLFKMKLGIVFLILKVTLPNVMNQPGDADPTRRTFRLCLKRLASLNTVSEINKIQFITSENMLRGCIEKTSALRKFWRAPPRAFYLGQILQQSKSSQSYFELQIQLVGQKLIYSSFNGLCYVTLKETEASPKYKGWGYPPNITSIALKIDSMATYKDS